MLYDMLASTAAQHPEKAAVELNDTLVTYTSLCEQVNQFAGDLCSLGLRQNDPVILLLPNGIEFVIAVFTVAKLGGIVVPLNTASKSEELRYYLTDSAARILISNTEFASRHAPLVKDSAKDCQIVTRVPLAKIGPSVADTPTVAPSTEVLYQYSSGSTGKPKRVVRSHFNLVEEANNFSATAGVTHNDRILSVVPMFHAHGFGNCLLASVRAGATMLALESFTREGVVDALTNKKATIFPGVPFMFSILADSSSIAGVKLSDLRLAFTAGAPLSQKIFQNFLGKFGVPVRQLYGTTETGSVSINLGATDGDLWASIGTPMQGVEINIVDEKDQTVKPNEVGELIIRSNAMTKGYAKLDEVNKETFRGGYFRSGDLGKSDSSGNLFVTGRKKLFINVGANKVDPSEVEAVLDTHPAIKESVVVGIPGSYGDEVVKAVIVLNHEVSAEDVKDWCQCKIADFKIPRIVEIREEIPRSPLGKVLRKYLQD